MRPSFSFRIADDVRQSLSASAAKAGRSLTLEIVARLEQSLADERALVAIFGSEDRYSLIASMMKACRIAEQSAARDEKQALAMLACLEVARTYFRLHVEHPSDGAEMRLGPRAVDIADTAMRLTDPGTLREVKPDGEPDVRDPSPLPSYDDRVLQSSRSGKQPKKPIGRATDAVERMEAEIAADRGKGRKA